MREVVWVRTPECAAYGFGLSEKGDGFERRACLSALCAVL